MRFVIYSNISGTQLDRKTRAVCTALNKWRQHSLRN